MQNAQSQGENECRFRARPHQDANLFQCDQTCPTCKRCLKAAIVCSGVLKVTDVLFRDETVKVTQRASQTHQIQLDTSISNTDHFGPNTSFRPSSDARSLSAADLTAQKTFTNAVRLRQAALPTPLQNLYLSGELIMTQNFFEQIVMDQTWLSFLPQLYYRTTNKLTINHAIHAASLFLFANKSGDYAAMNAARRSYGRSLTLLQTTLLDPLERVKDETLCAILLLHLINVSFDANQD